MLGNEPVRFGGGPRGKGPEHQEPRRAAYPVTGRSARKIRSPRSLPPRSSVTPLAASLSLTTICSGRPTPSSTPHGILALTQ